MTTTDVADLTQDVVRLDVPAHPAYVAVVRTAAAGLAARADLTLDRIEDLRIAVGEACALVLPEADEGSRLCGEFFLSPQQLTVTVSVTGSDIGAPDYDSFAWQVLDTMAQDASAGSEGGRFRVRFTVTSTVAAGMTGAEL